MVAYDWVKEEYPSSPTRPVSKERVQHPFYHLQAIDALQRFSKFPKPEKAAIKESLESSLISMEQWLTSLGQSDNQVMCIGEYHEESTRKFLAEEFFTKVSADVLMVEATPKDLKRLLKRMNAGRPYFPLLDADIMNVFRAVRASRNHRGHPGCICPRRLHQIPTDESEGGQPEPTGSDGCSVTTK